MSPINEEVMGPTMLIPKKNVVLDATVLSSLQACARLTDLNFNHNLRPMGGKSNNLEVGSLIHKILEVFNQSLIQGHKRDAAIQAGFAAGETYIRGCSGCMGFIPTICNSHIPVDGDKNCPICIVRPKCGHPPNEYPGMINTPQDSTTKPKRTGWKWVMESMEQYFNHYRNDSWVPLEVEVVKGEVLYEDDDLRVLWKSKLDLTADTHNGIFPIDHKSMQQNRDSNSMNNQFMGQCIIMKTQSIIIDKVGLQTTLKPEEKFIREMISYDLDRLIEWQSVILPYYASLLAMYSETNNWPPNFTHCENKYGRCSFFSVCSSNRSQRERLLKSDFIVGPQWDPSNID